MAISSAQAQRIRRIGFLALGTPPASRPYPWDTAPMRTVGWIEGRDVVFDMRLAGDSVDQKLAAELALAAGFGVPGK